MIGPDYFAFSDTLSLCNPPPSDQFSGGSWYRYKAVEAFDFDREDAAVAFLDRHRDKITENGNRQVTVVVGERNDRVTSWVE